MKLSVLMFPILVALVTPDGAASQTTPGNVRWGR